jgi:uncharacterized protein YxjI
MNVSISYWMRFFKVAEIHKKQFHLHDTYKVQIEANQDPAILLLLTIGIDEIRQH